MMKQQSCTVKEILATKFKLRPFPKYGTITWINVKKAYIIPYKFFLETVATTKTATIISSWNSRNQLDK